MKTIIKASLKFNIIKLLLVSIMLLGSINAYSYDFYYDGLNYNIISEEDRTAEVMPSTLYYGYNISGDLTIPPKAIRGGGITYTVVSIGDKAFYQCSKITSVTIPNSVTTIGDKAFRACSELTSVTIGNSVTTIGDEAFYNCSELTSVTIGNSVTTIGASSFYGCSALTSVTIPNSVTTIGDEAFYKCSELTSVTIPNSITTIGSWAFYNCKSLTSVTIPNSVTTIGDGAFCACFKLEEFNVDSDNQFYTSIDGVLYTKDASQLIQFPPKNNQNLFTIPNTVTTIGDRAFYNCNNLTSVTIPNSVTTIGRRAFIYCYGLISVTIGNSVTTIGDETFYNCNKLTSVTIGNSVTTIGASSFYGCSKLTSVTIPDSVTTIGDNAFYNCSELTSVTIGNSVTTIGDKALSNCAKLTSVYCPSQTPPILKDTNVFANNTLKGTLYVPVGCKGAYEKVDPWRNFWNIEEMTFTGVDDISGDDSNVTVSVVNGEICIDGAGASIPMVEVYAANGVCVYRGSDTRIGNLARGIYVVRIGSKAIKVVL